MNQETFVEAAKGCICRQAIPPKFTLDRWRICFGNCYLYAMRLEMDCFGMSEFTMPGFFSGKECTMTESCILENFILDCHELGLAVEREESKKQYEKPENNQYRIAVYMEPDYFRDGFYTDYHFLRQDRDGIWSSRVGWGGPIERTTYVPDKIDDYELKGVFKITKNEG